MCHVAQGSWSCECSSVYTSISISISISTSISISCLVSVSISFHISIAHLCPALSAYVLDLLFIAPATIQL